MKLIKVPYDKNSDLSIVSYCLTEKINEQKTPGIGPLSCCAVVEYEMGGDSYFQWGCSQQALPLEPGATKFKDDQVKFHGEGAALAQALDTTSEIIAKKGGIIANVIKAIYIEMSPCSGRCMPFLTNLFPGKSFPVYYSFSHESELKAWEDAAKKLCK